MTIKLAKSQWKKNRPTKLAGATLADVLTDMRKNGPKDQSGKRFFAVTENEFSSDLNLKYDPTQLKLVTKVDAPVKNVKLTYVLQNITVTALCKTDYCEPANIQGLTKPAQAEWKRFAAATMAHEALHYRDGLKVATNVVKALVRLKITTKMKYYDPSSIDSMRDAKKQVADEAKPTIERLVKSASMAGTIMTAWLDYHTKHGTEDGAKLDTTIV